MTIVCKCSLPCQSCEHEKTRTDLGGYVAAQPRIRVFGPGAAHAFSLFKHGHGCAGQLLSSADQGTYAYCDVSGVYGRRGCACRTRETGPYNDDVEVVRGVHCEHLGLRSAGMC